MHHIFGRYYARVQVPDHQAEQPFSSPTSLVEELKKCKNKRDLRRGKLLHSKAIQAGEDNNIYVTNTLISMYSKCGEMQLARTIVNSCVFPTVVSWNILILGYVENGEELLALETFGNMDCAPDYLTFVAAIKACTCLMTGNKLDRTRSLERGMGVHAQARAGGFDQVLIVGNSLIHMYCRLRDTQQAHVHFNGMQHRDVVSWTALIVGYVENGKSAGALELFGCMDCRPNAFTFTAVLKACVTSVGTLGADFSLRYGVAVHQEAQETGIDKDMVVANALIEMYSKCGRMSQAQVVFDGLTEKDVVAWTSLISGYVENGLHCLALDLFGNRMDCTPDSVTFAAALKACGSVGATELGRKIHDRVCDLGLEQHHLVATSLVDFYGKSGDMPAAEAVFRKMHRPDTISWTALIGGYSSAGDSSGVLSSVRRMEESDVRLNDVTMQLLLSACSHQGLVEEGWWYFNSMSRRHGVEPSVKHYACMVDMLGRANKLEEAVALLREMPFKGDRVVWTALLAACGKWCNVRVGMIAFEELVRLDEDVGAAYVLMRNIYEKLGISTNF